MSESSRIELAIVDGKASVDIVFAKLVNGCWVDEEQKDGVIKGNQIIFTGGLYDTSFHITVNSTEITLESDDYWEMVLLAEELKDLTERKNKLVGI